MAVTFDLYDAFLKGLGQGVYNLSTDSLVAILCTSSYTPDLENHDTKSDITNQLSTANGYTQNSKALTGVTWTVTDHVVTLNCDDIEWIASGGTFGPARYLVIYDDTTASDSLVGVVNFGANRQSGDGDSFKVKVPSGVMSLRQAS